MTRLGFKVQVLLRGATLAALGVMAAQSGLAICSPSGPTTTYQFVGACGSGEGNCTGQGVGQLTVQNYTLGNTLNSCNIVSFTYSSNILNFTITRNNLTFLAGSLPASLPGQATLAIEGGGDGISSNADGNWSSGVPADFGTTHTWSLAQPSVPALNPSTLIGLALMLALMGTMLLKFPIRRRSNG